jgi:hypothetical protein
MEFAGIDIRDQPSHRVPHGKRIVQGGQRVRGFGGCMSIAPTPAATEFGSLVGISVKEA